MSTSWVKTTVFAGLMLAGLALPANAVSCGGNVIGGPAATPACDVDLPGAGLIGGNRIGGFTDYFNFNLVTAATVSASASGTNSAGNITAFTISFFDAVGGGGSPLGTNTGLTNILVSGLLLSPGDYSIVISGTAPGSPGASYGGSLNLAPVPLPGALVLFGSGLVGLVALGKRRKKQLAAA